MKKFLVTKTTLDGNVSVWTFDPSIPLHVKFLSARILDALNVNATITITPAPPIR